MKLCGSEKIFFHKHYGVWARRLHYINSATGNRETFLVMWSGQQWSRTAFEAIKQLHNTNPSKFSNYDILDRCSVR